MTNYNTTVPDKIGIKTIGIGFIVIIITAVLWTLIVIASDYEIGYMALGVGALVGYSMLYANGKKGGKLLQISAALLSFVGVLLAKYVTFSYFLAKELATYPEYVGVNVYDVLININTPIIMAEGFTELFTLFDVLWVILAVNIAWKVTAFSLAVEKIKPEIKKVLENTEFKLGETK